MSLEAHNFNKIQFNFLWFLVVRVSYLKNYGLIQGHKDLYLCLLRLLQFYLSHLGLGSAFLFVAMLKYSVQQEKVYMAYIIRSKFRQELDAETMEELCFLTIHRLRLN